MTMDLYGHLIDNNLWDAAKRVGGILGHLRQKQKPAQTTMTTKVRADLLWNVERTTRFELATSTLGRLRSTN